MLSRTDLINIGLIKAYFFILTPTWLELEVCQFVCDCNTMYDAGKEDYLRPSQHTGLDWIVHGGPKWHQCSWAVFTGLENDAHVYDPWTTTHEHGSVYQAPVFTGGVGKKRRLAMLFANTAVTTGAWLPVHGLSRRPMHTGVISGDLVNTSHRNRQALLLVTS